MTFHRLAGRGLFIAGIARKHMRTAP